MIAAALLLAMSLLTAPGRISAHRLDGIGIGGWRRPLPQESRWCTDPFATASALDVIAVCLESGMAVAAAAAATAPSAPPDLRAVLKRAADLLALGADPDTAWSLTAGDADLETLLRLARRSANSGSALAQGLRELAEQLRQDAVHAAEAAGERAGVLIAGPLGLCFLPAFVCLGIVPVVAGLASDVLRSGVL